jgi:hypothetical protein
MPTATKYNWKRCADQLPPLNVKVMTKIDDDKGVRNEQSLRLCKKSPDTRPIWFFPESSLYVYYTPTHWAYIPDAEN